jgi:membrane-associated phospholipid phosphatase
LLLTGAAVLAPAITAPTGADHELRLLAQEDLGGSYHPEPFSVWAPFVLTGGVAVGFGVSVAAGACEWQRVQAGMLQAVGATLAATVLLKWTTGREFPAGGGDPTAPDRLEHPEHATDFELFSDPFAAWPSGHAAVMFSIASALRASAPGLGGWRWLAYPLAAGVSFGMWFGDHHWAGDVISGALLGEALGGSVGRAFAPNQEDAPELSVLPVPGGAVLSIHSRW